MPLDVVEIDRLRHAWQLVDVAHVAGQVTEVLQPLAIALEVTVVHSVETHQGGEQAYVGLGQLLPEQIPVLLEMRIQPVQLREQLLVGLFIG